MANMSDDLNGAGSGSDATGGADGSSAGPGGKKLERKLDDRWLAGVCIGLADYTGIDVSLIRVIFAVLTMFGGVGPIAYLIAWVLVPEEGEKTSIAEKLINKGSG